MRIIKAAKKVHEVQFTCPICHSILGIESGDIRFDSTLMKHCIKCPVCDEYVGDFDRNALFFWITDGEIDDRQLQSDNALRQYEV